MTIPIRIRQEGVADVRRFIRERGPQIAFATQVAVNEIAFDIKKQEEKEITQVFDQPVAFTRRSVLVKKARNKRKIRAEVFIRDQARGGVSPSHYLAPQIFGGGRSHKGLDVALRAAGLVSRGEYGVPTRHAKTKAGNITGRLAREIIKSLREGSSAGYGRKGKTQSYFIADFGFGKTIFRRRAKRVVPMMTFERQPKYRKRFDFFGVANRTLDAGFRREFERALVLADRTSR